MPGMRDPGRVVSMKSGLEGRNNQTGPVATEQIRVVSMKSGLEGRNNQVTGEILPWAEVSQ